MTAIQVDWGDYEETVILMSIRGTWTAKNFYDAMDDMVTKSQGTNASLELMVDLRNSLKPPANIMTMIRTVLNRSLPERIEQVVVIASTSFWERMYNMVDKMFGSQIPIEVTFVDNVDDAYSRLYAFQENTAS